MYSCNPGFTLAGGRIRTCLDGGQWSGSAPTCEGKYSKLTNMKLHNIMFGLFTSQHYVSIDC